MCAFRSVVTRNISRCDPSATALKDWQRCDELCAEVVFSLIRISGQKLLFRRQIVEEREPLNAVAGDSFFIDLRGSTYELTKVVPIRVIAVNKLAIQSGWIEPRFIPFLRNLQILKVARTAQMA